MTTHMNKQSLKMNLPIHFTIGTIHFEIIPTPIKHEPTRVEKMVGRNDTCLLVVMERNFNNATLRNVNSVAVPKTYD